MMLQEMRGKFLGGLFFGALGGIAGFRPVRPRGALLACSSTPSTFVFSAACASRSSPEPTAPGRKRRRPGEGGSVEVIRTVDFYRLFAAILLDLLLFLALFLFINRKRDR